MFFYLWIPFTYINFCISVGWALEGGAPIPLNKYRGIVSFKNAENKLFCTGLMIAEDRVLTHRMCQPKYKHIGGHEDITLVLDTPNRKREIARMSARQWRKLAEKREMVIAEIPRKFTRKGSNEKIPFTTLRAAQGMFVASPGMKLKIIGFRGLHGNNLIDVRVTDISNCNLTDDGAHFCVGAVSGVIGVMANDLGTPVFQDYNLIGMIDDADKPIPKTYAIISDISVEVDVATRTISVARQIGAHASNAKYYAGELLVPFLSFFILVSQHASVLSGISTCSYLHNCQ